MEENGDVPRHDQAEDEAGANAARLATQLMRNKAPRLVATPFPPFELEVRWGSCASMIVARRTRRRRAGARAVPGSTGDGDGKQVRRQESLGEVEQKHEDEEAEPSTRPTLVALMFPIPPCECRPLGPSAIR